MLTKSTIETLAQADEFEMVREVQVRCRLHAHKIAAALVLISIVPPGAPATQEYFADYLTLLPSLFTLSLPPVAPTPKVSLKLSSKRRPADQRSSDPPASAGNNCVAVVRVVPAVI